MIFRPRLSLLFLLTLPAQAQEQAKSAARFLDSVGVNTHLTYIDTAYGNTTLVTNELKRLGVEHVRDGYAAAPLPEFKTLGAAGIRFILNVEPPYFPTLLRAAVTATTVHGVPYIEGWEGQNELDIRDTNWVSDWASNFASLQASNQGDVAVLSPPLAFGSNALQLGPVQTNYGSFHPYPGGQNPSVLYPAQVDLIQPLFPNTPLVASESGYHNAFNDHSDQPAISYATGAKYVPRLLLESFNAGVYRTYIYELLDEESSWNTALQDPNFSKEQSHWGLIDTNGAEKPAFTATRNLMLVLKAGDEETATPTTLNYTLSGGTNIHHLLLQKSPTVYDLVLWQNVASWNPIAQTEIVNPSQAVFLSVDASSVITYQPSVSTGGTSQQAIQGGYNLTVPDEALVVEIVTN